MRATSDVSARYCHWGDVVHTTMGHGTYDIPLSTVTSQALGPSTNTWTMSMLGRRHA